MVVKALAIVVRSVVGWQGNSRLADLCRQVYLQIPASGQVDWSGICGRRKDNLFGMADIDRGCLLLDGLKAIGRAVFDFLATPFRWARMSSAGSGTLSLRF